jgi:hypothetical protein
MESGAFLSGGLAKDLLVTDGILRFIGYVTYIGKPVIHELRQYK